jgi:hypothetical protein
VHGQRVQGSATAADEFGAAGLVRGLAQLRTLNLHEVQKPRRSLFSRAWTPGAQDRLAQAQELGLHKQVAKRRVRRVGRWRRQNHLGKAGEFDGARGPPQVGNGHSAQLDVVLGRYADLDVRFQLAIAATKLSAPG